MPSPEPLEDLLSEAASAPPWSLLTRLPGLLTAQPGSREEYRKLLAEAHEELKTRFLAEEPVEILVHARAALIDAVLRQAWFEHLGNDDHNWALVAVGGYGRGELHPCSDIDILLLVAQPPNDAERSQVERLITFLWDIGLEVGHSVRTVGECVQESAADVSVMTTLLEARLLHGDAALLAAMNTALSPPGIWPEKEFFEAKLKEQVERHLKANDTAYNLEPNVKTGPGGLRDIQTIGWVAKRHFGAESLDGLARRGFITASELRRLKQAQSFLWKVRFGLHIVTGRREDRLLFDHQLKLAQTFGYEDASYTLAVEQFMQRYYRTVMDASLLNELLLQLFREAILSNEEDIRPLNARFQVRNGSLEARRDDVFARTPSALLELFVLLQQNPDIKGVRASTMRAVTRSLWLIDEEFRQNPRHHRLFMDILRAPVGVTHELRRMNTYEVLGRYIPAFGRIVGRMQYDLFHAYTVDAHTLFVLSNLRRFAIPRYNDELPELSRIMQQLPKPEIAYLAALFHDIAKGRGGDHSELGSVDAEAFCLEQGLSRYDARLVAWLVRSHLELSVTAQKQDITDPEVVNAFARKVGDETHLDHLYVHYLRRRARHESEAVEFVEGVAVSRVLRTREAGAAPRTGKSDRRGRTDRARPRVRRGRCSSATASAKRISRGSGPASPRPTSCSTRPRRSPGTRGCWSSASPVPATRSSPSSRAAPAAVPRRCSPLHPKASRCLRAPRRCWISSASTSSMRASRRPMTASRWACTTSWKMTACRSRTRTASAKSSSRCCAPCSAPMRPCRWSRGARRARHACSTPPPRSRSASMTATSARCWNW